MGWIQVSDGILRSLEWQPQLPAMARFVHSSPIDFSQETPAAADHFLRRQDPKCNKQVPRIMWFRACKSSDASDYRAEVATVTRTSVRQPDSESEPNRAYLVYSIVIVSIADFDVRFPSSA